MIGFARFGLVYFTKKPLRLATNLGLLCLLFGLILIVVSSNFFDKDFSKYEERCPRAECANIIRDYVCHNSRACSLSLHELKAYQFDIV